MQGVICLNSSKEPLTASSFLDAKNVLGVDVGVNLKESGGM